MFFWHEFLSKEIKKTQISYFNKFSLRSRSRENCNFLRNVKTLGWRIMNNPRTTNAYNNVSRRTRDGLALERAKSAAISARDIAVINVGRTFLDQLYRTRLITAILFPRRESSARANGYNGSVRGSGGSSGIRRERGRERRRRYFPLSSN